MSRRSPGSRLLRAPVALFLALGLGMGSAGAQGVSVALSPGETTVAPGAEFEIELQVTQAGSSFNGFDAMVSFDPAALTRIPLSPTSLQQGTLMTGACGNTFHRFRSGAAADTITDILLCSGVSVTGPGQIYRLRFRASTTAQVTTVSLVPGKLKFYDAGLFVSPVFSSDARIGIGMAPTAVEDAGKSGRLSLAVAPNPSRGMVVFTIGTGRTGPESLTVRDVQGRLVRRLAVTTGKVAWDGRLESGEAVPNGAYFATLASGGRTKTIRLSLIR